MSGITILYKQALSLGLPKMRAVNANRTIFEEHIQYETSTRSKQERKSTKALLASAKQVGYKGGNDRTAIIEFLNIDGATQLGKHHKRNISKGKIQRATTKKARGSCKMSLAEKRVAMLVDCVSITDRGFQNFV